MAWDWITPVGSGVVAVAGLVFGRAPSVRSQRQTADLARENNQHARAVAELAGDQARRLEEQRHAQAGSDRRAQRVEESYVEIATTVIRAGTPTADDADLVPMTFLTRCEATGHQTKSPDSEAPAGAIVHNLLGMPWDR